MRISDWSSDVCSSDLLKAFTPPAIVKRLRIFGDNDPKYGGQAAAYALANRMSVRLDCMECSVEIPNQTGTDWAYRRGEWHAQPWYPPPSCDRKSDVYGQRVSVFVEPGSVPCLKKKKHI